jgi:hypothetical protein
LILVVPIEEFTVRRIGLLVASVFISAILPLGSVVAANDRAPSNEEKARIENALRLNGYTNWKNIESEGKVWEVDDATGADGKTYDLELAKDTLQITKKKAD